MKGKVQKLSLEDSWITSKTKITGNSNHSIDFFDGLASKIESSKTKSVVESCQSECLSHCERSRSARCIQIAGVGKIDE